ncbi:hypothetical protein VIGAN_UM008300, partial [Vigna angularis var. angularis]
MTTGRINQVAFAADDQALPAPGLRATTTVAHTSKMRLAQGVVPLTKPNQTNCVPLSRPCTRHGWSKNPIPHITRSRSK